MTIPSKRYLILPLAGFATANVFVTRAQTHPSTKVFVYAAVPEAIGAEGMSNTPKISEMKVLWQKVSRVLTRVPVPVPSPYSVGWRAVINPYARLVS